MGLRDFLLDLMNDPAKLDAFRSDPEGILAAANLSAEERDAVMSGDRERVTSLLPQRPQPIPHVTLLVSSTKVPYPRPDTPPKPTTSRPRSTTSAPRSTTAKPKK